MTTLTIEPRGDFSLRQAALFGFGGREASWDGRMRMAFTIDDLEHQAGVVLTQSDDGVVHVEVVGDADPETVRGQVARILSLDHDATSYDALLASDPMLSALRDHRPGTRPPQFHSPYEAAIWAVLSLRRPARQMARVRFELSRAHGWAVDLAGEPYGALPTPRQLLAVDAFPGIPDVKLERMHAVARAALDGTLGVDRLRAMDPGEAQADLQKLPGIGPFSAALVVIRACGLTDVLPVVEPKLLDLVGRRWSLGHAATSAELTTIARAWTPWRTWVSVLVRATGDWSP